jgi:hypothetical protein
MDRSRTKEFKDFALLLEGCLQTYAEKLTIPLGSVGGLSPDICRDAMREGRGFPSSSEFSSDPDLVPSESVRDGIVDAARILGRIEKTQRCEISDLFLRWLGAERRRNTPSSRRQFVVGIARRFLALTDAPLSGANPAELDTDEWRCALLEDPETGNFLRSAAEMFTAAADSSKAKYPATERFTDLLLGARLCGHVEGLAHFPMKEIVARFSGTSDPQTNAVLAEEFGRAIATAALGHPDLWSSSTDAIVPGLHEHLAQTKPVRGSRVRDNPDLPSDPLSSPSAWEAR